MSLSFCIMRHQEGYILFGFSPFENWDGGLLSCLFYFALWSPMKGKFYLVFHQLKMGMEIYSHISFILHYEALFSFPFSAL